MKLSVLWYSVQHKIWHPHEVYSKPQNIQQTLEVKTQLYYITEDGNSYTFQPPTGHHQVVHTMKRARGCTIYNCTIYNCILYSPQPSSLCVQPDDGLLETETCSCYHLLLYNIVVF